MIIVYNKNDESHEGEENNYVITRPSILSNPYTHLDIGKTRALFQVKTREESIDKYAEYFDMMYAGNKEFKGIVDEIFEKYKRGETIYLGCVCKPLRCHGDIIVEKLQKRLIKEKIKEYATKERG